MENKQSDNKKTVISKCEYTAIKNEIISLHRRKDCYEIVCYTIIITLFGFALQLKNEWLFLLPYLILFPMQRIILNKQLQTVKLSANEGKFSVTYSSSVGVGDSDGFAECVFFKSIGFNETVG